MDTGTRRRGDSGEHPGPRGHSWWRTHLTALLLLTALTLSSCVWGGHPEDRGNTVGPGPAPTTTAPGTTFSHVFIIVLENEEASNVIGSANAPYVNSLAARYASAAQYFGVTHPSLPNYLALTAGTPKPLDGTDCSVGPSCHVAGTHTNIADEIEASGRTWMAYMESMPAPCTLQNAGMYAVRHNPFVYFDDIRTGANDRCATHDVPYDATQFAGMLQGDAVPNYTWLTPNLCDDGHDACGGNGVAHSDAWLSRNVPPILASPAFQQGGVLFITWDEGSSDKTCCGLGEGGGQVATLVISPLARQAYQSTTPYNHYSLLRTIEDAWRLGQLGNTDPAVQPGITPMRDFFTGA